MKTNHIIWLSLIALKKCRIFSSTNHMDLHQTEALCTELWNLDKEFNVIRYANSFQVGLTLVIETNKDYLDIHGTKRYLQALSSKQAQNWFHSVNDVVCKKWCDKVIIQDQESDENDELDVD
eukprot:373416_1